MPYLTQLADVARRTGFPVTEVPGWTSRGHGPQPSVMGIVAHHTAGRDDMHVVRDGRPGLDGPLSQFWLRRDGRIFVVAAGRCWHNAPSTSDFHTNSASIGIEAENNGREAWPAVQLDSYKRLCAELCKAFRLPASRVKGHKEVQVGKPDPHHVDMNDFRADVARLIEGDDMPLSTDDVEKIWNWDGIPAPDGSKINPEWRPASVLTDLGKGQRRMELLLAALASKVPDVDEAAIVAGVLAGLAPDAIAQHVVDALPADLAEQVLDGLRARLEA